MKTKDSIVIVGEGITEQYYFKHLKKIKNYRCIVKPRFFEKTSLDEIKKTTEKLLSGDVTVVCVFDADISIRDKKETEKLKKFIKKYEKNKNVIICDSLPAIEFWFLLHFVKKNKAFNNNKTLCRELSKYLKNYEKKEAFLEKEEWVTILVKKMDEAVKNAKTINADGSYSNVYKAIELLESNL
ncbi:MAG TPA: RloB family protein [bacterium]|nr:RloB family protein [bacterium]HPS31074.1 RloB family protein [bacterium]